MFAIIETGGKQYKVSVGDKLRVEKLSAEEGAEFSFDKILLKADSADKVSIGTPYVSGSEVKAVILEHGRDKKKIIFKYKPKARTRVKKGHRQEYTEVEIKEIK